MKKRTILLLCAVLLLTGSPQTVTVTVNSANTDTFTMVIDMTTGTYTIE
jgi:hypothetical protein